MTVLSVKRVILVTGGSRGIGRAIVQRYKEEGWAVAACSREEKNLVDNPADFKFMCDVGSTQDVQAGVQKVLNALGRIDVLVNNAGIAGSNPLQPDDSDEMWHQILNTNLNGTYYMCKHVAPHLPNDTGRIVNISSVLGLKGVADASAYSAAKHAVIGFTRSFANYLAPRKIAVNAICPGWTHTEMGIERMEARGLSEKDIRTSVPMGRMIQPSEVADLAFFLGTSAASAMITGQAITMDGGFLS